MKYAIVLPDGAADEPIDRLDGRTPLQAANTPHIDWISENGRQGRVVTVPEGFTPGSDVATLTLLGYDPNENYNGRAPFEAAARGITARSDQLIFRCNFVTITEGAMKDFTAGHISQAEADQLIADLNLKLQDHGCIFHGGISYRNLMVGTCPKEMDASCTPPHDFPDQPVAPKMPTGSGSDWIRNVMDRARSILAQHEVNLVRADLGENPATDIWLWGQGRAAKLKPFASRYDIIGIAVIAAVDLIRGIARCAGMTLIDVAGATGYLDTDYQAKGKAGVEALNHNDLVIVHIEAPDEAGHLGDLDAKIAAIEQVDKHVVGPLLEKLKRYDQWKIMVAPDHPTPVERRIHTSTPPPFCIAGHAVQTVLNQPFSEATAATSDLQVDPGHELMEYFLRA